MAQRKINLTKLVVAYILSGYAPEQKAKIDKLIASQQVRLSQVIAEIMFSKVEPPQTGTAEEVEAVEA